MSRQPTLTNATEVRDHWWWRPGWHIGRSAYTWHITFSGQTDLHRLVSEYQEALRPLDQVDLVPLEWLHLTMQGVGFTDEVSDADVDRITEAVRHRLSALQPAQLTFHRPVLLPEATALAPTPADPIHTLRGAIREAIGDVWGMGAVPEADDGFRAHVSVGYINAPGLARPISDTLARVVAEPATITVNTASLIVLNRDERIYRWRTRAAISFG
jgi:2'-5' RNA ligase